MSRRTDRDAGFATIWVVVAMAVVVIVAGVAASLGAVALERLRASAAADAAALAAAMASLGGPAAACERAGTVARLDAATVVSCRLDGAIATVSVTVDLPGPLARFGSAYARARAGPMSQTNRT